MLKQNMIRTSMEHLWRSQSRKLSHAQVCHFKYQSAKCLTKKRAATQHPFVAVPNMGKLKVSIFHDLLGMIKFVVYIAKYSNLEFVK